jgi:anti-sigma factor RsiW
MNPEEFEELLPAYLDGALNAEQTARVDAWLERSAEAREALDAFRRLDAYLETRREQVPPSAPFVRTVFARPYINSVRAVLNVAFSFPAISSLLLVLFGITLFIYRGPITAWFNRNAEVPGSESLGLDWVRNALLQFSGADIWTVTAVYVGVTVAILLSTSLMLMRFLRD